MSQDTSIPAAEIDNYTFGNDPVPEGYNPDSQGFEDPPVGTHIFELTDFGIVESKEFKGKDFTSWVGNQIRPRLTIPAGQPNAGASILDFLPIPTKDRPMPKALANRWANFVRSLGFQLPSNSLIPPGFSISRDKNSLLPTPRLRCAVRIEEEEYEGKKKIRVAYFGYKRVDEHNGTSASAVRRAAAPAPNSNTAMLAAAQVDINDL